GKLMRRLSGDAKPPPLDPLRPSRFLYSRALLCALIFGPTIPATFEHPQPNLHALARPISSITAKRLPPPTSADSAPSDGLATPHGLAAGTPTRLQNLMRPGSPRSRNLGSGCWRESF